MRDKIEPRRPPRMCSIDNALQPFGKGLTRAVGLATSKAPRSHEKHRLATLDRKIAERPDVLAVHRSRWRSAPRTCAAFRRWSSVNDEAVRRDLVTLYNETCRRQRKATTGCDMEMAAPRRSSPIYTPSSDLRFPPAPTLRQTQHSTRSHSLPPSPAICRRRVADRDQRKVLAPATSARIPRSSW